MADVDLTAPVRCTPRSRIVPLGECLDDFRDDAINLRVRGAVAGRCSRCSDGRQRRMLVAEGRMPLRAGEPRPRPKTPAPAAPAAPDNDCDDDNPCTTATPAAPPAAAPAPTAAAATPAPWADALRDLADAARELATAARELAGLTRAVGRLRLAPAEAPATTATPAPRMTATARTGADLQRYLSDRAIRPASVASRLILATAAAAAGRINLSAYAAAAGAGDRRQTIYVAASHFCEAHIGYLRRVAEGVYEMTPAGREYAARVAVKAAAAVGGAP